MGSVTLEQRPDTRLDQVISDSLPPSVDNGIYASPRRMDLYLLDAQERIGERKFLREQKERWQNAMTRLGDLIAEATSEGALDIAAELRSAQIGLSKRFDLGAHSQDVALAISAESTPVSQPIIEVAAPDDSVPLVTVVPSTLRKNVEDDIRARAAAIEAELKPYEQRVADIAMSGLENDQFEADISLAIQLRVVACELRALRERAINQGVLGYLDRKFEFLFADLSLTRARAKDTGNCDVLELRRAGDAPVMGENQWRDLAVSFTRLDTAMRIWREGQAELPDYCEEAWKLFLTRIAAAQTDIYRRLEISLLTDHIQQGFFWRLKETVKSRPTYIPTFSMDASFDLVDAECAKLPTTLAEARACHQAAVEWDRQRAIEAEALARQQEEAAIEQAKQERKNTAVAAALAYLKNHTDLGQIPERLDADREELFPILMECLDAGVPPSNAAIRNALMLSDMGTLAVLDSDRRFDKIAEAIRLARVRKGLDVPSADTIDDDTTETVPVFDDKQTMAVMQFFINKKVCMLGGDTSPERLAALKEFSKKYRTSAVGWIARSATGTTVAERRVKEFDIVLFLKNQSSHELGEACRKALNRSGAGKHFITLPAGYGSSQIAYQVLRYLNLVRV